MRPYKTIALFALGLVFLSSCASVVNVEKDPSVNLANYKTYTWLENVNDTTALKPTGIQDRNLHTAVSEALAKASWKEDNEKPELLIKHDLLIEKTTRESRNPVYSTPFSRPYFNPYLRRWSYIYYPSQFMGYDVRQYPSRESTLTLSLIDAKTDKVIWQGWTTNEVASANPSSKELEKSVKTILGKLDAGK